MQPVAQKCIYSSHSLVTSVQSLITFSAVVLLARSYTRVHRFSVNIGARLKFQAPTE